mmetsp:Transcript_18565/g.39041  ORF Transcript_18565/g.39041 Transcript_18565/m.39041 type:complete len:616 (-) Transcript_18565:672-2519(-)
MAGRTLALALTVVIASSLSSSNCLAFNSNSKSMRSASASASTSTSAAPSLHLPLLSSYRELMIDPISETNKQNNSASIDDVVLRDICEEWIEESDEPQGILEDQLVDEQPIPEDPAASIFDSDKIPEAIKYLVPVTIVGTIILFLSSNASVGASVDLSVRFGLRPINIPGLFQFSLLKTAAELYGAGIYPLLVLIVCFSGIWPYAKLLLMLHSWMTPSADKHQRERYLLTLDSLGRLSLVDNYVLILFVVAFRFHLELGDNLGLDVFVTPVYGFFSFLAATCLSLILGHAVLFFHRKTMTLRNGNAENAKCGLKTSIMNHEFRALHNGENSSKRLSRIVQALLLMAMVSTMSILCWGFLQESYTFEIGGLAGIVLGEDLRRTSYSDLSLGAALPSSVENPGSANIVFLQMTFFFFTVVTPILCLALLLCLMILPMTLKWQQRFLLAAEIARSWSAVEVFLLSILAALFQISTFASFMIGDKCNQIDSVAKKVFDEQNTDTDPVCFTVDAFVESNCWYLLVGAFANFLLVSFCLRFAENAVEEKMEDPGTGIRPNFLPTSEAMPIVTRCGRTFVQTLFGIPLIGRILFVTVPGTFALPPEEDATIIIPLEDQLDGD